MTPGGIETKDAPKLIKNRAIGLPRRGKKPYPEERRRVLLSIRVLPSTKTALLRINAENIGRAIDELVTACMSDEQGMFKSCKAARDLLSNSDGIPVTRI